MSTDAVQKSPEGWASELLNVVFKAMHIRTQYNQRCLDEPVYSIDDYLGIISTYTGYVIDVSTYDWASYHVRGGYLNYEGNLAKIAVAQHKTINVHHGISYCEQRYITIKEAAHLVIDDKDSHIDDCIEFIDGILLGSVPITEFCSSSRSDIFYAKIFAMELLFPWEYREQALVDITTGKKQYIDVAKEFMIPEKELRWFLSEHLHPHLQKMHSIYDGAMKNLEASFTKPDK